MGDNEKTLVPATKEEEPKLTETSPEDITPEELAEVAEENIVMQPVNVKETPEFKMTPDNIEKIKKMHVNYKKWLKKKAFADAQKIIDARKKDKRREKARNARRARKVRLRSGG